MITHLHPNPNPWPLQHPANLPPPPTSSCSKPAYTHAQPQPQPRLRPRPRLSPQAPHAPWVHMVYGLLLDSHQLDARARAFAAQEGHAPILAPTLSLAPAASRSGSRRSGSGSNMTQSISIGALRESYIQRILSNLDAHAHAHSTKGREGQKTGEERTSVEKVTMLRTSLELNPKPKLCAVRTHEGAIRMCVAFVENIDVEMRTAGALPSSLPLPPPLSEVVERFRSLALLETGCEPGWYEFFC